MMIISCGNARVYNDPFKHGFVHDQLVTNSVYVLYLLEEEFEEETKGKESIMLRG